MAAAAAEVIPTIEIDDGPGVDDVPDDFFEDFEKNEFLDGLEVLDDLSPSTARRRRRSMSGAYSSETSQLGLVEKQSHVLNEIKKLERDIAERRRKLCRTRTPMQDRSPTARQRRRSLSRRRRGARSRSRSRGRRMRTRSRSRGRRSRSRPRPRGQPLPRGRRDRPKSREKMDSTGRKSLSFLEELSQKFAEQGKSFPEAEAFDINAMNYNRPPNSYINPMAPMFNPNPMMGPQPPQWLNFNNQPMMGPGPPVMVDSLVMPQMITPMEQPHPISMDLESSNSNERMETPPPPSIVKREFEEPNSRYCGTDEMIRKTFRESVLTRCRDVANLLRASETQLAKPPNLHYIPTVISTTLPNGIYLSPLQSIHNVEFSFDNKDSYIKAPSYIKLLSDYTSNVVHTLGFNIKTAKFPVNNPTADETAALPEDAVPADLKFDIGTQTDPLNCERCVQNDLREFKDKTTQVAAVTYHIGCQTSNEDPYSFAEMTPAQVCAINDFGKILKNSLMPTNYREATDLRDRLFNIYQTCTGLNKTSFMRDNENRINPGIFRETNERVAEPMRDIRMQQNDMMHQDRYDNRPMNMEQQRFESNRLDRSEPTFPRQQDPFQSSNNQYTNMSMNSQDRFMQSQNNDRFDMMAQRDSSMRNLDARSMQQHPSDFGSGGGGRMSDPRTELLNMPSNRYDMNQDRFPSNTSMNQQQSNMWGSGGPGSVGMPSSLSPIGNNSRLAVNDDFARRTVPQPLFPETSSGVMTCKQIMEMERGSGGGGGGGNRNQPNSMQFDNNNMMRAGGGAGGRGNRGGAANRSNRGGNANRF